MSLPITRGRTDPPARVVIYGPPGIGKSTWAASCTGALALDYERGLEHIGCDRVLGADTWGGSVTLVQAALAEPGYRALVIDTADRLEDQAAAAVCRDGGKKTLSDFKWGDGFHALSARWRELLSVLEGAEREVVLVAHQAKVGVTDPELGRYDGFTAQLSKGVWSQTFRWADGVFYASYDKTLYTPQGEAPRTGQMILSGQRVLRTQSGTGFEAKNRWNLPAVLPLDYAAFAAARAAGSRTEAQVREEIVSMGASAPEEVRARAADLMSRADTIDKLITVEKWLKSKVSR